MSPCGGIVHYRHTFTRLLRQVGILVATLAFLQSADAATRRTLTAPITHVSYGDTHGHHLWHPPGVCAMVAPVTA
jgi:hypothetical protein